MTLKVQAKKNKQMGLYQTKKFLHHRKPSKSVKTTYRMEKKNFANCISDEEGCNIQKYNAHLLLSRKRKPQITK